jgi:hypothetical protein
MILDGISDSLRAFLDAAVFVPFRDNFAHLYFVK